MAWQLTTAAVLTVLLALAHSILGERFIIHRLMHRDQPQLFGSDAFTKRTLRFAWHALTIVWVAVAAILLMSPPATIVWVLVASYASTALLTVIVSRGQHLSWVGELTIVALLLHWVL